MTATLVVVVRAWGRGAGTLRDTPPFTGRRGCVPGGIVGPVAAGTETKAGPARGDQYGADAPRAPERPWAMLAITVVANGASPLP
jgi:hypothetical protein